MDRRRVLVLGLGIVLAVGVASLIGKAADYARLLDELGRVNAPWLVLCLAGELLAYTGYVLAYRDVARVDGGPGMDYWAATRVVAVGFGAFAVGAAAGGLAVDYWALRKAKAPRHRAIARVLALNTLQWTWLAAAAAVAAIVLLAWGDLRIAVALPWVLAVPPAFALAAWVSSPSRGSGSDSRRRERGSEYACGRRSPTRFGGWSSCERSSPSPFATARASSATRSTGSATSSASTAACVRSESRSRSLRSSSATPRATPSPPSRCRPAERAASTPPSSSPSMPSACRSPALLGVFVYRLFSFWLPVLPALAALPGVRRLGQDLEKAPRRP